MDFNPLTPEEEHVIVNKGTEPPFTGEYHDHSETGTYVCRRCDLPLYRSHDKFESFCGWPSFDDEIDGAVSRVLDADGKRTEIVCARCDGHRGHVFDDGPKPTGLRYCMNATALNFQKSKVKS